jgi:hypothetical protein
MPTDNKAALRRYAVQLAAQLPEDGEEAREVVGYMLELVDTFLHRSYPQATTGHAVLPFRTSPEASSKRLASANGSPSGLPK